MNKKSLVDELIEYKDVDQTIIKSFYLKDELCPDIFEKKDGTYILIDNVRNRLLKTADAFIDFLNIDFFVYDVILTGSLANYNWSEYSDVDLHILLSFNDFTENAPKFAAIVKEFLDSKKNNWNTIHEVKIKQYEIEIYVQDVNEKHLSSGVYSVLNNKWLVIPIPGKQGIDDQIILQKGEEYATIIDNLIEKSEAGIDIMPEIDDVKTKLKKFRQSGLESGGEYSYENLTFKLLRRNGYIGKLINLKRNIIDKKLSITENKIREQKINIDGYKLPIIIIPYDKWMRGKNDPTEYSADDKCVRVRSDYDYKKDTMGYLRHELIHYLLDINGYIDDNKPYPSNSIEKQAYKYQFDFLKKQGFKNIDDVLKLIDKEHHKDILINYW